MRRNLALALLILAPACATAQLPDRPEVPPIAPIASPSLDAPLPAEPASTAAAAPAEAPPQAEPTINLPEPNFDKIGNAAKKEAVRQAISAAREVIASAVFRRHLSALSHLDSQPGAGPTTGPEVLARYLGLDGATHQYPTTYFTSVLGCGSSTAVTDPLNGTAKSATTTLRSCTLDRIRARPTTRGEGVEKFACAINTIVHEWAHSIPDPRNASHFQYLDTGHDAAPQRVVSYTVGAIAQCAYLEAQGFRVEEKFDDCVKLVGDRAFDPKTCDVSSRRSKGWAERTFGRR